MKTFFFQWALRVKGNRLTSDRLLGPLCWYGGKAGTTVLFSTRQKARTAKRHLRSYRERAKPVKVKVTCENVFDGGVTATIDEIVRIDGTGTPISNEVVEDSGQANDDGDVMRLADSFYIYNLSTKSWDDTSGARFKVVIRITKAGHADTLCEVILKSR